MRDQVDVNAAPPSPAEQRLRMYSWGIIIAIALAVVVPAMRAAGADAPAEIAGGDYPAFYGAGIIVGSGDRDSLYSFEAQAAAQAGLLDSDEGAWYFAYPPVVALPYAPLSALPYVPSLLVHTAAMALLLVGAVLMARPMMPWIRGREVTALAAMLLFWPLMRGLHGGSNTALTMFLLVAAWRLARDGRDVAAGLTLAALLYKPQYGLAPAGLFLLDRRPRLASAFGAGAAVFYALSALVLGPAWIVEWLDIASAFEEVDLVVNGHSASSIVAFAQNALGVGDPIALSIGYALSGIIVVALMWMWWRRRPASLDARMAIAIPGLLLLSPHTMAHDVGIVLISVGYLVGVAGRRSVPWLVAIYGLGSAQVLMKAVGFSPGLFTLGVVAVWSLRELWVAPPVEAPAVAAQ